MVVIHRLADREIAPIVCDALRSLDGHLRVLRDHLSNSHGHVHQRLAVHHLLGQAEAQGILSANPVGRQEHVQRIADWYVPGKEIDSGSSHDSPLDFKNAEPGGICHYTDIAAETELQSTRDS
jgi:hypothetical protein